MFEVNEVSPTTELIHGHTVVGVAAVPLTRFSHNCVRGILVRAPGAGEPTPNTEVVWVGRASVAASSDVDNGGIPITPGGSVVLPINDPSKVYVISLAGGQDIAWMGV